MTTNLRQMKWVGDTICAASFEASKQNKNRRFTG
jgi:hypothetical protein